MPEARSLRPLGGWDHVSRGRFEARHDGHVWTVDLDYFDFGEKLHLYRDGVEVDVQKSPAKFDLDQSATIEAAMGLLGMRQVELVVEGETWDLTDPGVLAKAGAHTQTVCDFHVEGLGEIGTGHGVFEFLSLGAYEPYGFKSFGDVAK